MQASRSGGPGFGSRFYDLGRWFSAGRATSLIFLDLICEPDNDTCFLGFPRGLSRALLTEGLAQSKCLRKVTSSPACGSLLPERPSTSMPPVTKS